MGDKLVVERTFGMLKSDLKRAIRSLGFDLRRYTPENSEDLRFTRVLSRRNVNLIFDVGANTGQFGEFLRNLGYHGRIVSFEPISGAWERLVQRSSSDALWEISPRVAVGDRDAEVQLHISANSVSSSLLDMLGAHLTADPDSSYVRNENVSMRSLDSIGLQYLRDDSISFIKIDTQGYEAQVLHGAPNLLSRAVGLRIEVSLVPLYAGQVLYDELIPHLKGNGFELWDIASGFVDAQTDRLLQIDATFLRNKN